MLNSLPESHLLTTNPGRKIGQRGNEQRGVIKWNHIRKLTRRKEKEKKKIKNKKDQLV